MLNMARPFSYYVRRYHLISYSRIALPLLLVLSILYLLSRGSPPTIIQLPPLTTTLNDPSIDWARFAYVQYVTSPEYLCNALMLFSTLRTLQTKASLVLLYPSNWSANAIDEYDEALELTPIARLLQTAYTDLDVALNPISILKKENAVQVTWADSFTKLLAFNLTSYSRVLALDSDALVLQSLDELFLLPAAELAMPWTYFGAEFSLSSQLMLITPSASAFTRIEQAIESAGDDEYDMDIVAKIYADDVLKLPQRPYNLLTGEFRRQTHAQYLQSGGLGADAWDVDHVLAEAKYVHFSDWPVPKPWIRASNEVLRKEMPKCRMPWSWKLWAKQQESCKERKAWLGFYVDFAVQRKAVCGKGFELQAPVLGKGAVMVRGKWYETDKNGDVIKGSGDD